MKRYNDYIKKTALFQEQHEECLRKAEYYKYWNTHTSKYTNWTGPQYYEHRVQKEREAANREIKKLNLTLRRQKLSEKLRNEALEHSEELRKLKFGGRTPPTTQELRNRYEEIHEKLDSDRKSENELKLYHQWRRDEPAIRQAESEFKRGMVQNAWVEQLDRRRMAEEAAKAEDDRIEHEQNIIALQKIEISQEAEMKKREDDCRLAQINAEQAHDRIRANAKAEEELRKEELAAARLEQELYQLEKEKPLLQQRNNQNNYRNYLHHQAAFKLKQRANEIQRELEEDRELLQKVYEAMERENSQKAEQRLARRKLAETLKQMAEQSKRESALVKLSSTVFQEEAILELKVQEERWAKERNARKKLVSLVLAEQQAQAKLTREKAEKQREMIEKECEEMSRIIEHNQDLQKAQEKFKIYQQHEYQKQLDKQISEKKALAAAEREKERIEEEKKRRKEMESAAKLDLEIKNIMKGRQKVAWL